MNRISRLGTNLSRSHARIVAGIHTSSLQQLKKIEITQDEKKKSITIEGKLLDSEAIFGNRVIDLEGLLGGEKESKDKDHHHLKPCPFCVLEKKNIFVQYTDVLVLRQFLTQDGAILPQRVTGLCNRQHKKLVAMTKLAKHAGLILNLQPRLIDGTMPNTDPRKRTAHLKWNSYFDSYEEMRRKTKFI